MEAAKERREFDKVMRKLNDLGNTLKLAFEFGGGGCKQPQQIERDC